MLFVFLFILVNKDYHTFYTCFLSNKISAKVLGSWNPLGELTALPQTH